MPPGRNGGRPSRWQDRQLGDEETAWRKSERTVLSGSRDLYAASAQLRASGVFRPIPSEGHQASGRFPGR